MWWVKVRGVVIEFKFWFFIGSSVGEVFGEGESCWFEGILFGILRLWGSFGVYSIVNIFLCKDSMWNFEFFFIYLSLLCVISYEYLIFFY